MTHPAQHIAFIGGGNMASAIIGGLIRQGMKPQQFSVVEPYPDTAAKLLQDFGITALPAAGPALAQADLVVWAVKPQVFSDAAAPVMPLTRGALHLSVAAGIRTDSISRWVGTDRVVRCMPNTPALVGQGITANVSFSANATGRRAIILALNGGGISSVVLSASSSTETNLVSTTNMYLFDGDQITVIGFQNSGGALNTLVQASGAFTALSVARIGA